MMGRLLILLAQVTISPTDIGVPQGDLGGSNITSILRLFFGVAGAVAVLIITIAGFKYVISQGDPQATAKAKNTILYAIIGLAICVTSFGIVTFVLGRL